MVKIVLDAGHGGMDPGAVYEGRQEKDDVLQLVFDVGAVLEQNGVDVEYTRVTDVYQSPYEKAAMANQSGADYFVSIHRNARDIPNTEGGVETLLYSTEDSIKKDMAEAINRNLEEIGFTNRGVIARPNLVVLRDTDMPALLVEAGFIDSEQDNALYDANLAEIADAIAYGILEGLPQASVAAEANVRADEANSGRRAEGGDSGRRADVAAEANVRADGANPGRRAEGGDSGRRADEMRPAQEAGSGKEAEKMPVYRVQAGVWRNLTNARMTLNRLNMRGYQACILYQNGLYYVQTGAYPDLGTAVNVEKKLKNSGFPAFLVTGEEDT